MKQGNNNNSCSTCSCDYLQLHLLPAPKSLFSERFNVRVMSIIWFIALVASFSLKYLPISEIKILPMLMSTYFYGGSCVEDVTTHLMNHLSLHPTLRTCSSDTILRANSVMRGRFDARRTLKNLVADLRYFYNRNELYAPAPIQPEDSARCLVLPHQGVFPRPNRPHS